MGGNRSDSTRQVLGRLATSAEATVIAAVVAAPHDLIGEVLRQLGRDERMPAVAFLHTDSSSSKMTAP